MPVCFPSQGRNQVHPFVDRPCLWPCCIPSTSTSVEGCCLHLSWVWVSEGMRHAPDSGMKTSASLILMNLIYYCWMYTDYLSASVNMIDNMICFFKPVLFFWPLRHRNAVSLSPFTWFVLPASRSTTPLSWDLWTAPKSFTGMQSSQGLWMTKT